MPMNLELNFVRKSVEPMDPVPVMDACFDKVQAMTKTSYSGDKVKQSKNNFFDLFSIIGDKCTILSRNCSDKMLYTTSLTIIQVLNDFQVAERQKLEEPASDEIAFELEVACAMIDNNLRCHDLAMEMNSSIHKLLPKKYANKVDFKDICQGFLELAKESVRRTCKVIFEVPRVQALLSKRDWFEVEVTILLLSIFEPYVNDVKKRLQERSFDQFISAFLEDTIAVYVDHLLIQKNLQEEGIEKMKLDEEAIMDFFGEYTSAFKAANMVWVFVNLRKLASSQTPDSFIRIYTNILEDHPDCPPEVVEKIVGLREGISKTHAKKVVRKCEKIYKKSLVDRNNPLTSAVFSKVKSLSTANRNEVQRFSWSYYFEACCCG